jgi:hypothetical protein
MNLAEVNWWMVSTFVLAGTTFAALLLYLSERRDHDRSLMEVERLTALIDTENNESSTS